MRPDVTARHSRIRVLKLAIESFQQDHPSMTPEQKEKFIDEVLMEKFRLCASARRDYIKQVMYESKIISQWA